MSDDLLGMSDEDFLEQSYEMQPDEPVAEEGSEEEVSSEDDLELSGSEDEIEEEQADDTETEEETEGDAAEEDTDTADAEPEDTVEAPEDDFKRILAPFKANGSDVQVKSVDEALQLMQMGANYTKKMQALQPNLKVLKTLEKNALLDEDKLNYLIDLSNKEPKAIARLIKESGIDPEELEEDTEYTPNNHQVSDNAVQLEQVLESIESTPTYAKCMDVVGNQWDDSSKDELTQDPTLIAQLNEQMSLGIFDKIQQEVERAKMFGGLSGLSNFDAYKTVGAQMHQSGQLTPKKAEPVARTEVKPKDTARSQQRKAASNPKPTKKTKPEVFNPLNMSDEEFLKLNNINV